MQRLFIVLCFSLLVYSCASTKSQYDYYTEEQLYQKARSFMIERKSTSAAELYQMLETRFPFGEYAEQSQLEIITAYYQASDYDLAIAAADRFIRLHPDHPEVDFAYYYKGLSKFDANRSIFDKFFDMDMSKRDPGKATESYNDFAALVTKFPDSRFAGDARGRMKYLRNLLARHEVHVANYYFKRGAYTAAANRGRYVVEHYQESPAVSDGLAIMVQAYKLMGMDDLANASLYVLKENYPNHYALDENGNFIDEFTLEAAEQSRLNKASFGVLDQQAPPEFDNRDR
jgi:outer membrane protein assembly factor BamD